jgi:hypothetical protein
VVGGKFGQKLVVGDTGGRVQTSDLLDFGADGKSDIAREYG